MKFFTLAFFSLCLLPSPSFAAEKLRGEHVVVSWVAPDVFGPGRARIGIRFEMEPRWHIYWKNPGDSGAAPKFQFSSDHVRVQGPSWPAPRRLPFGPLTNLGYEKDVVFVFDADQMADPDHLELSVKLEWLVCKEECLPGFGTLTLRRPLREREVWSPRPRRQMNDAIARLPGSGADSPWFLRKLSRQGDSLSVEIRRRDGQAFTQQLDLFPFDGELIPAGAPRVESAGGFQRTIFPPSQSRPDVTSTGFLLVETAKSWEFPAIELEDGAAEAGSSSGSVRPIAIGLAEWSLLFLLAVLGGLLLNAMPCVLPVLSIKLLSLVHEEPESKGRWRESLRYTAGVLAAFLGLGAVFLVLRSAGSAVGWGFHLQSPLVVYFLVLLFWLMGLNFLGVYEFGTAVMNWAGRGRAHSSFATGLLSVFVAAPCTGPFMGSALGATATMPALPALSIFFALGLGLASPFLLIAAFPVLVRKLPRPGIWMERFKQFLAFPLFGTCLWLMWVLQGQAGESAWLVAGSVLWVLAFALWWGRSKTRWHRVLAWVLALWVAGLGARWIHEAKVGDGAVATAAGSVWAPYSKERIQAWRSENKAVFIDFTASWCITCQVNKKVVLDTDFAQELFRKNGVALVRADWTRSDPAITAALAEFGRNSVPLYVYYPPDKRQAVVLPQILAFSDIEKLFKTDVSQGGTQ